MDKLQRAARDFLLRLAGEARAARGGEGVKGAGG
jgi:hypothetical protein